MANVSLKTDFKDGDKLFAQQLNNNFSAIMAALAAMNRIVWQDDPDDTVVTFRGTTEEINSRDVIDGQLLYDTTTGETYIDYGSQRISTGSGNAIFIGEDEPTNAATQLWIDPTEMLNVIGSEIESGSNTNGKYIKYSDGTMLCYGIVTGTSTLSDYWGQFERTQDIAISYPQTFVSTPTLNINNEGVDGGPVSVIIISNGASNCAVQLLKANGSSDASYKIHYVAIGRWK